MEGVPGDGEEREKSVFGIVIFFSAAFPKIGNKKYYTVTVFILKLYKK